VFWRKLAEDIFCELPKEQLAPETINFSNEYLSEVENELASELAQCVDFHELSDKTKKFFVYIFNFVILPLILGQF